MADGGPPENHPLLGSHLLCEPIDDAQVALAAKALT